MSNRQHYDEQLLQLDACVGQMGELVEQAIERALRAMQASDRALARQVAVGDDAVDQRERAIEHLCMELLLRQQPVASDLRRVSTTLKMVTDLERMGDAAADIAELVQHMAGPPSLAQLGAMAAETRGMVHDAIRGYRTGDVALAQSTIRRDDVVDAGFDQVKGEIVQRILAGRATGDDAVDWLMVAKYLERLGDHAVNVCEWTVCCATGLYKNEQIM